MKTLFISIGLVAVLFLSVTTSVEAQKRKATKKANQNVVISPPGKCAVTVRDDLLPNKAVVVVVGCDSLGIVYKPSGGFSGSNGGIAVLDGEMNLLYKWEACTACGGFFSRFAGTKKVGGHNALMVSLYNGPVADATGRAIQNTVPLYFNGKKFTFAEMPSR